MKMNILIIEDELPAARRLEKIIKEINADYVIVGKLDSIESSVNWFKDNPLPDLILMDIELADGQSFEIFKQVTITSPVIFTTAYDEYALKAFTVNSIDYLLKPVDPALLQKAFDKLLMLKSTTEQHNSYDFDHLIRILKNPEQPKQRYLVKQGEKLLFFERDKIAFFVSEDKLTFLVSTEGRKYVMDLTLDEIEQQMDATQFFRLNRQYITHLKAITSIHTYFNGKLKLTLKPETKEEVLVSREKSSLFKLWIDS